MKRAIRLAILLPVAVVAVALEMAGVLDRLAAAMELDDQGFRTAQVEDAANEVLAEVAEPVDWALYAADWEIEQSVWRTTTRGGSL